MANKNHDLDPLIIESAIHEFSECGYQKASLRKVAANANVTIGAIYTRYATKDILFCSLVLPLIGKIERTYEIIKREYQTVDLSNFSQAIKKEYDLILDLLYEDYTFSYLLLCKSQGSSLEHFLQDIVERKIKETIQFFEHHHIRNISPHVLNYLISSQFQLYIQIFKEGYDLEEARNILHEVMIYHEGGWAKLLELS